MGSIAGFLPGTYQAVYNATKAFLDCFSFALRHEVKDQGITVTCLMPGATETEFFERADMMDTKVGQSKKDDPADVAKTGFDAMMRGDGDVVSGWQNKLQTAIASVTPGRHPRAGSTPPRPRPAPPGVEARDRKASRAASPAPQPRSGARSPSSTARVRAARSA